MKHSSASKGICDRCDEYISERYIYEFLSPYGRTYDLICESCLPKCECGNMEIVDGTDLCSKCIAEEDLEN